MAEYYIGCSTNEDVRFMASSGGIGTSIIKYLLSTNDYGTSMTFFFDKEKCKYVPKLIYDFSDYNNCGSIYQDVDIIGFLKDNLSRIIKGIIITCLPCQVRAVQSILDSHRIKCFIISLCCSGQTTVEGIWYYYKLLGIKKEDVIGIQFRGNGWPSGIQISLKNGQVLKRANYSYPWTLMHQSLLFRPRRCLFCPMKTSYHSDVSLADPWLREYEGTDNEGNTLMIVNNDYAHGVIKEMNESKVLSLSRVDEETFIRSQKGSIHSKAVLAKHKKFFKIIGKIGEGDSLYKKIVTSSTLLMRVHCFLISHMQYKMLS